MFGSCAVIVSSCCRGSGKWFLECVGTWDSSDKARGNRGQTKIDGRLAPCLVQKNYAVGLEISCPGGACCRAPEIPNETTLAGRTPSNCEPVHSLVTRFGIYLRETWITRQCQAWGKITERHSISAQLPPSNRPVCARVKRSAPFQSIIVLRSHS